MTDQMNAASGATAPSGRSGLDITSVVLVLVLALALELYLRGNVTIGSMTLLRGIGLALTILGFVFWGVARIQLGKSFALRAKAKTLVTHGLYSKIRNPIYVFGTVLLIGILLTLGQPRWLLLLVILIPAQVARARKEARVLEEKFGDQYREYRRKTWF
ncbi:MAG TPA: isoprenylcysteine carboxylmethyltransferase family protein [Candidatus Acidoferrales bacterium]|nr:isoprenylcysteine carboxylmethyltransferase family protein [Candidatus Acidoferrales bacterium]